MRNRPACFLAIIILLTTERRDMYLRLACMFIPTEAYASYFIVGLLSEKDKTIALPRFCPILNSVDLDLKPFDLKCGDLVFTQLRENLYSYRTFTPPPRPCLMLTLLNNWAH